MLHNDYETKIFLVLFNLNTLNLDTFKQLLCKEHSDKIVIKQFASIGKRSIPMVSASNFNWISCTNYSPQFFTSQWRI